jgi:uncharacterized DUF497 family protein
VFDWTRIRGFDWDGGNRDKSARKHRVTPAEAEQVFFNRPLLVLDDGRHSDVEPRFHALGRTDDGRFLHLTFTLRREGTMLRVISARDMIRKERIVYDRAP